MPPHDASLWRPLRPWLSQLGLRRRRLILGALLMGLTLVSAIGLLALVVHHGDGVDWPAAGGGPLRDP